MALRGEHVNRGRGSYTMKKTVVLGGLAALVLGCLLATAPGNADSQGDSAAAVSPFKGRIIVAGSKSDRESGAVLEDAKVQRLGERYFLVGTGADYGHPKDWMAAKVVWVAIDDVAGITEFADLDDYKKTGEDLARKGAKESCD